MNEAPVILIDGVPAESTAQVRHMLAGDEEDQKRVTMVDGDKIFTGTDDTIPAGFWRALNAMTKNEWKAMRDE